MSEFVKAEGISKNRVRYTDSSGRVFIHSKGTWAWRNNNPGNIRKPGKDTKFEGIISSAGGFLVMSFYGVNPIKPKLITWIRNWLSWAFQCTISPNVKAIPRISHL